MAERALSSGHASLSCPRRVALQPTVFSMEQHPLLGAKQITAQSVLQLSWKGHVTLPSARYDMGQVGAGSHTLKTGTSVGKDSRLEPSTQTSRRESRLLRGH